MALMVLGASTAVFVGGLIVARQAESWRRERVGWLMMFAAAGLVLLILS